MREEGRRLGGVPRGREAGEAWLISFENVERGRAVRSARRQGGEHIAQRGLFRRARVVVLVAVAVEVDQAAALVDVTDRVDERGLPAGKQRYDEENPR